MHKLASNASSASQGLSRNLLRSANAFNSLGLIAVSALFLWQAVERILNPAPVAGVIPIVIGLSAAAANWGVARLLKGPSRNNAAIRLAYIHNMGDVYVSPAPVFAGIFVSALNRPLFDPLIASAIAVWIIVSTLQEVISSRNELLTPEKIACGHEGDDLSSISDVGKT